MEGFSETVLTLGGDPVELLRRSGLPQEIPDPDTWIAYSNWLQLLENAAQATACPHFGIELSRRQGTNILGPVGFILQQAPTVGVALRELASHFAQHNQGADVTVTRENELVLLGFQVRSTTDIGVRQQLYLAVGIGVNLMRHLCGGNWRPNAAYFTSSAPDNLRPFKEHLRCPMYFDWEYPALTFDAALLDTKISQANEHLHRILEQHLLELERNYPNDFPGKVSHLIRQSISTGDCSIDRVASFLNMNKRTLQRQLSQRGASYKSLLEGVRFSIATQYLRESKGSLTRLADMLCYSELSAFSYAFKQQTGLSPRQWQRANRPTSNPI